MIDLGREDSEGPLAPDAEEKFADERAAPMRKRVLFIVVVSFLIWLQQFVLYEKEIFPSRTASLAYRAVEAAVCVGLVAWLWRPRPLRQVEAAATVGFSVLAVAHAYAILSVYDACVVPFTLTAEWGQMVIVLASMLSFRPTLALLAVTWISGSLATSIRAKWDTDLFDHLILLGIYVVLLAAVRSFDKLRRREFVGRVRLAEANSELRRAEEIRGRLFVNLSHDFRTPLALIHAEAELLRSERSDALRASALERIRAQTMSLADLTNELLELARLEAGKTPIRTEDFDVCALAREIAVQFESAAGGRTIRVAGDADEPVGVSADPSHARRILTNLVANAVRHLPAGGEVRIEIARASEGDATIDVVDGGPGIAPERREAIFERFASFDATGSVASGIGLPVARELAELNGGSLVLVEDAPQTTFRVTLPASKGALAALPRPERRPVPAEVSAESTPADASTDSARSLVIVEDHEEMRRLLCELLGSRFAVRIASTCAEARAELAGERPSAVLCDVLLPDGAGYDVLEWVRAQRRLEGVPVLFLSALGTPEQRARGMAAGADDYIAKPFSTDELVARLDAACARADERTRALDAVRLDLVAELHDGVTASLSRAALLLDALDRPGTPPEVLGRAREAVREGLAEARKIMSLMDGGVTSWDVVVDELRADVDAAAGGFSIRADMSAESDGSAPAFSSIEKHTVRRIAREALTNAIKHGRPSRVRCALVVRGGEAVLSVDDDGTSAARGQGTGRGIAIAERRVRSLGGRLSIEPRAGGGTTLRARFPLQLGIVDAPAPRLAMKTG